MINTTFTQAMQRQAAIIKAVLANIGGNNTCDEAEHEAVRFAVAFTNTVSAEQTSYKASWVAQHLEDCLAMVELDGWLTSSDLRSIVEGAQEKYPE